jgi:transcriptional regulator with XRE-family HTH domain
MSSVPETIGPQMTGAEMHLIIKHLGLSKREIASLLDVSQRTLQRWSNDPRFTVPGSVACALRCFVALSTTSYNFREVVKINFRDLAEAPVNSQV